MSSAALAPPPSWSRRGLTWRPVAPEDEFFLRDLYADLRAEELASTGWSPGQKRAFTDSQFDLQDRHFRMRFPEGDFLILQRGARPIGRLYLDRQPDGFLVIDIGLMASSRGRGLGREILQHLWGRARDAGAAKVWLHVRRDNPRAIALYARLGFQPVAQEGHHWRMEWPSIAPNHAG